MKQMNSLENTAPASPSKKVFVPYSNKIRFDKYMNPVLTPKSSGRSRNNKGDSIHPLVTCKPSPPFSNQQKQGTSPTMSSLRDSIRMSLRETPLLSLRDFAKDDDDDDNDNKNQNGNEEQEDYSDDPDSKKKNHNNKHETHENIPDSKNGGVNPEEHKVVKQKLSMELEEEEKQVKLCFPFMGIVKATNLRVDVIDEEDVLHIRAKRRSTRNKQVIYKYDQKFQLEGSQLDAMNIEAVLSTSIATCSNDVKVLPGTSVLTVTIPKKHNEGSSIPVQVEDPPALLRTTAATDNVMTDVEEYRKELDIPGVKSSELAITWKMASTHPTPGVDSGHGSHSSSSTSTAQTAVVQIQGQRRSSLRQKKHFRTSVEMDATKYNLREAKAYLKDGVLTLVVPPSPVSPTKTTKSRRSIEVITTTITSSDLGRRKDAESSPNEQVPKNATQKDTDSDPTIATTPGTIEIEDEDEYHADEEVEEEEEDEGEEEDSTNLDDEEHAKRPQNVMNWSSERFRFC